MPINLTYLLNAYGISPNIQRIIASPPPIVEKNKPKKRKPTVIPSMANSDCRIADIWNGAKEYQKAREKIHTEVQRLMIHHGLTAFGLAKKLRLSINQAVDLIGPPVLKIPIPKAGDPHEFPTDRALDWEEILMRAQWFFDHTQEGK